MTKLIDKLLTKGELLGSRAFGCQTRTSDWDIALTKENYNALVLGADLGKGIIESISNRYKDLKSIYGDNLEQMVQITFEDKPKIDLFIFKSQESIDKLLAAISIMRKLPSKELMDKDIRIKKWLAALYSVDLTKNLMEYKNEA